MLLLLLSLAALAAGPLLYRQADRLGAGLAALDGFILTAIGGLAAVHIVPHAVEAAGLLALAVALIGFLGPDMIEKSLRNNAARVHSATLLVAVFGLVVHGFFDGVGLGTPEYAEENSTLALAVLLHRLPIGVTLWWLLIPTYGAKVAGSILAALGISTVIGYSAVAQLSSVLDSQWLGLVQALIAGSLLHVVIHRPAPVKVPASNRRGHFYSGVGALLGIGLVALLSNEHIGYEESHHTFGEIFLDLALESAPALLLAFALAGIVQVAMPSLPMRWMRSKYPLAESFRGVAFGLPLPICSCGVIPLYQSLIRQSVPATAAMAFLVATPELGLDAILISLPLLGPQITFLRVTAAVIVALVIGYVIGRMVPKPELSAPPAQQDSRAPIRHRLRAGLGFGFGEIVDHTGPWLLLGIAIAALIAPFLSAGELANLPTGIDVVLFTLLGMPSYVCASGATPLVAVLLFNGVSPGAAIAFLLAGPATNITTFGVLSKLHGKRIAFYFAVGVAALAISIGLAVNTWVNSGAAIDLPDLQHNDASLLQTISLIALSIIFALSILRQGPRGFIGQILSPYEDEHDHSHGHDHHDHSH